MCVIITMWQWWIIINSDLKINQPDKAKSFLMYSIIKQTKIKKNYVNLIIKITYAKMIKISLIFISFLFLLRMFFPDQNYLSSFLEMRLHLKDKLLFIIFKYQLNVSIRKREIIMIREESLGFSLIWISLFIASWKCKVIL